MLDIREFTKRSLKKEQAKITKQISKLENLISNHSQILKDNKAKLTELKQYQQQLTELDE